jgi:hypothetical protein
VHVDPDRILPEGFRTISTRTACEIVRLIPDGESGTQQ